MIPSIEIIIYQIMMDKRKLDVDNADSNKTQKIIEVDPYLERKNAHERDPFISFEPGEHKYTVHGVANYVSVTTLIDKLYDKFNTDEVLDNMFKGNPIYCGYNEKYHGMSQDDVRQLWTSNCNIASREGTNLHFDIECFYNNMEVTNNSIEYGYFNQFRADNPHLVPYRTEWIVYIEEFRISGSIDMVYELPDKTLMIYDWKRCKDITKEPTNKKFTVDCLKHIPANKFWKYAIQLNIYRAILERKYGKKVVKLMLVCLHPTNPSYECIAVPMLDNVIDNLLNYWLKLHPIPVVEPELEVEAEEIADVPGLVIITNAISPNLFENLGLSGDRCQTKHYGYMCKSNKRVKTNEFTPTIQRLCDELQSYYSALDIVTEINQCTVIRTKNGIGAHISPDVYGETVGCFMISGEDCILEMIPVPIGLQQKEICLRAGSLHILTKDARHKWMYHIISKSNAPAIFVTFRIIGP